MNTYDIPYLLSPKNGLLCSIISKQNSLKVLDLGCAYPNFLVDIYHNYDCEKLVGVDKCSVEESVLYFKNHNLKDNIQLKNCITFFDLYNASYVHEKGEKEKIESEKEFNEIFLQEYKFMEIEEFLASNQARFNLVLASNVFHFELSSPKRKLYLKSVLDLLENESVFLLRVQNNIGFDFDMFNMELKSVFKSIEISIINKKGFFDHAIAVFKNIT